MKKVLLLGDSIRQSYQSLVKEKLDCLAEVSALEENCCFVKFTLWHLPEWIDQFGKPDIIHWNNGIWDVYHINGDIGVFTPLQEYLCDVGRVLRELGKTGAEIIWATTTPVNDRNTYCLNSEIDEYNDAAVKFMLKENIRINDLNKVVKGDIESYIGEDHLHLTEKGQKACADAIVNAILKCLK